VLCVVPNETSTGVTSRVAEVRQAIDNVGHPSLRWSTRSPRSAVSTTGMTSGAVDLAVAELQKGLMLAPGLSFNADVT
jgi:alanine-glyoxylate transaminase / serine-glyoxylate transaminase / serine-pyruvate transaminase